MRVGLMNDVNLEEIDEDCKTWIEMEMVRIDEG
jgi:hypothetical protein